MRIFLVLSVIMSMAFSSGAGPVNEVKHIVKKGETIYSISRHYGIKVNDLMRANPRFANDVRLKPGQQIYLPTHHTTSKPADETLAQTHPSTVPHKITAVPSTPEVAYREEDNRNRNEVELLNGVSRGDENGSSGAHGKTPKLSENEALRTPPNTAEYPVVFNKYQSSGYEIKKSKGAATYLEDNTSGNQYLALYNGAENGSVIQVTNLMNQKTIYVKVVGRVPQTDASKEVILTLSNTAAVELGANDRKILVEVQGVASR